MRQEDLAEILDELDRASIDAWLDGGWGVDALLGEQTRPHKDLDLVVRVEDTARMRDLLASRGLREFRGDLGSNHVIGDGRRLEVDVHPVRFDEAGNGFYRMENGEDWVFAAEGFQGVGRLGSRVVRCLTAEQQMIDHATGYEPIAKDFADMRLLHERLGTVLLPPYDVEPRPASSALDGDS
jgi:lincosamide nucleotidyltransferase A/C/D/E